jgi:hypothetical protein
VTPAQWLPVHEALVQGLLHALNNRVAALSGIVQLHEAQLSTAGEGMQQLASEVEKLRGLMQLMRQGVGARSSRREPVRMGEALRAAATLLPYHLEARQVHFTAPDDAMDVEPVYLWNGDAQRLGVLAFLAMARSAGRGGGVTAAVARVLEETVVTVTGPGSVDDLREAPEFVALAEAASREGGTATCAAGPAGSVLLTLALPGLTKATARSGPS